MSEAWARTTSSTTEASVSSRWRRASAWCWTTLAARRFDRSWTVLAEGGAIVSAAAPDIAARTPAGRRGLWFVNQADAVLLAQFAQEIAQGSLISKLSDTVGFNGIPAAIERNRTGPRIGKVVADFTR